MVLKVPGEQREFRAESTEHSLGEACQLAPQASEAQRCGEPRTNRKHKKVQQFNTVPQIKKPIAICKKRLPVKVKIREGVSFFWS
jgi:hypothetical protein